METLGNAPSSFGIDKQGIDTSGRVQWNLSVPQLIEQSLRNGEGILSARGGLVVRTGQYTGRNPGGKFLVETPDVKDKVWWGNVNQPMSSQHFNALHQHVLNHYKNKNLYVSDCQAGWEDASRINVRVVTETAWHNLFAKQLFVRPDYEELSGMTPDFTILNAPTCQASPGQHGTNSEVFVVINFEKKLVLIGGTAYAGEIKKSIFTIMNYLLPTSGRLSMHCSANVGESGDVALFFGLSGTGKTTLSADPERGLIGDDEHGWGDDGVFNIEGGCYAKCINLSEEYEPQIYNALHFGSVLENVIVHPVTQLANYDSDEITENTRAAYPLDFIENAITPSRAGHPENVIFLTCDAFGVFPPVSRLSEPQAMYHFLSGYTAKVAGTEAGVTEPQATFSACFGAPFLPLPPTVYAEMLGEKLKKHDAHCWLINTGWSGGPYGVGKRVNLKHTRAMVHAVLDGKLKGVSFSADPMFGVEIPDSCPDVPAEILRPINTWSDKSAYEKKAKALAGLFVENFKKFDSVSPEIAAAGPRI
jgi:phosphoenolpyruvate carboxykinase (ATP)